MNHYDIEQLIDAVIQNNPSQVNQLLNQGIDPNECLDDALITPLHFAAQHNALKVIPLLLAAGANLHATSYPESNTPMDIALMHQHHTAANLLLAYMNLNTSLN